MKKDYVIVANGNFLTREIIIEASADKIIVALDGASTRLAKIGIKPHIILGDFDSIDETKIQQNYWGIKQKFSEIDDKSKPYKGNYDVTIVPAKDQNYTDLVKAIRYCDSAKSEGANSITLICATGGRMDHHEAVIRALRTEYKKDRPIVLHTEQQTLRYMKDEKIEFRGNIGAKCGILAYPKDKFTSKGLVWDGNNYELNFGYSDSVCNELKNNNVQVSVTEEALLIMPPQLKSQVTFMAQEEKDRFAQQWRDISQKIMSISIAQLNQIRKLRKEYKKKNGYKKPSKQPLSQTYYVTHKKEATMGKTNENEIVLLSVTPRKYSCLLFFKSCLMNENKKDVKGLMKEFKKLYMPV